jgi:hypothetical protein
LLIISCHKENGDNGVTNIDGYWEIYYTFDSVEMEMEPVYWTINQSDNDFSISLSCDPSFWTGTGIIVDSTVSFSISFCDTTLISMGTVSNDIMSGDFSSSIYSGTFLAYKVEQPVCLEYYASTATITVDGDAMDWAGISPIIVDSMGDGDLTSGSDLWRIYVARDNQNVYARIDVANGTPSTTLYYAISFYPHFQCNTGDRFIFINLSNSQCSVASRNGPCSPYHTFVEWGNLAISGNTIEVSVPFTSLNPPTNSFVSTWVDQSEPFIDATQTVVIIF